MQADSADARFSTALSALRQSLNLGAVAVVGAGLSIAARFPATAGLDSLLFESLRLPAPQSDQSPVETTQAWESLVRSPTARIRFQTQFAAIDRDRSSAPSKAHESLARLIHAGVVETVVSLNWDTALERAYERLYGTALPVGVLLKPHGDAAEPETEWVLPHEDGVVTAAVRDRMNELVHDHARTLVVIGYSESDETISRDLIHRVGERWRTVRIGPSASGAGDIALTAEEALGRITTDLLRAEEVSSWHSVRFGGSRGIDAALAGERLGPADVDACPEFAEVARLVGALTGHGAAVLNGSSGSGKSITAYQALRKLSRAGYEVLRLRDSARDNSTASWLEDLRTFPRRKALFIDDAQDIPADVVRELAESATPERLVLIVGVDQVAGGVTTVNISGVGAVAQLAHYVRTHEEALLPLVSALDDQIGNRMMQTPLDFRLRAAEREGSPWRFFYVLTGGWRRARRLALELREQDRADIALTAVAVAQIARVDAGVTRAELVELLGLLHRDEAWLDKALGVLRSRRAVLESDGRLRCPHLQSAYHVVGWMLHPPAWDHIAATPLVVGAIASAGITPPRTESRGDRSVKRPPDLAESEELADQEVTSALIAHYLDLLSTPLRGCTWLVGRGLVGESKWVLQYKMRVLDAARWAQLAERALAAPSDSTAEGAQLLTETLTWAPEIVRPIIRSRDDALAEWFRNLTPQNAWALGDLINGMYNHDHAEKTEDARQLASHSRPSELASLVLDGGWGHIYSTSHGVERIMTAGGADLRAATATHLDRAAYEGFLASKHDDLDAMAEFVKAVAAIDFEFAIALFQDTAKEFARLYSLDPVENWSDVFDVLGFVLGFAPHFLRGRRKPPHTAFLAASRFAEELDVDRVARAIASPSERWDGSNFPELLSFLEEVNPRALARIVAAVDLTEFERHLRELGSPNDSVLYVVAQVWERRPDDMLPILDRLEPSIARVSPLFALMDPDLAIRALRRGVPLDLGLHHHHWGSAALALARLSEVDRQVASEVLEANLAAMVAGLTDNSSDPFEALAKWVRAADDVDVTYVDRVLLALPQGTVAGWHRAVRRPKRYGHDRRREIAPLVFRARALGGPLTDEAVQLLSRFPSLHSLDPEASSGS